MNVRLTTNVDAELHAYPPPRGHEALRVAWVDYQRQVDVASDHGPDLTVVTSGAREGVWLCVQAFASGSTALVPAVGWPAYSKLAMASGARLVFYRDGEHLAGLLEAGTAGAPGLVVINTPHNPTGEVISPDVVSRVSAASLTHGHVLVWDGVYDFLATETVRGLRSLGASNLVRLSSASKCLGLAGLRVGFAQAPAALLARLLAVRSSGGGGTTSLLSQQVLAELLVDDRAHLWTQHLVEEISAARETLTSALGHSSGARPSPSMFLWLKADAAEWLRAARIDFDSGDALGDASRVRLCVAREREVIERAAQRLVAARG